MDPIALYRGQIQPSRSIVLLISGKRLASASISANAPRQPSPRRIPVH